jgi:hypothetical protein
MSTPVCRMVSMQVGHAKVMFEGNLCGILHLLIGATQRRTQACCSHGRCRAYFALAAHFRARDRGIVLDDAADRRRRQEEYPHAFSVRAHAVVEVVANDSRNHARRAIGGRSDNFSTRCILFIDGHGIDREKIHHAMRLHRI